ncbi:unnamed protein product [[Candida] boidinii]|nr:unnamed protein product [[Candida] boidinii]
MLRKKVDESSLQNITSDKLSSGEKAEKAENRDTKVKIEDGGKLLNTIESDVTGDSIEIDEEIDPSDHEVYDRLLSLVEDLITSLNHGDADSELIELLYSIFKYYQLTKLERYSLEYMITSNSSELSVSNSNNMNFSTVGFENEDYSRILESIKNNTCRFLMPNLSRTLNQYTKLLKKIGILDDNNIS